MRCPARVLRGTGGSGGSYLLTADFAPMTVLGGGIGAILIDNDGIDLPTVTLTTSDFDALQAYLVGRKEALDSLAACATCPEQAATAFEVTINASGEIDAEQIAAVIASGLQHAGT